MKDLLKHPVQYPPEIDEKFRIPWKPTNPSKPPNPMTSAQIEYAAREFCRRTGRNPDEIMPPLSGSEWRGYEPRWKSYTRSVEEEYERMCMTGSVLAALAKS